jgi:cyclic beta-1,2-glucan synthetase
VVAADIYSVAPHAGRGGWTWYTGSAGWMYRAGIEGLLGLTRKGDRICLNPCLPGGWTEVSLTITLGDASYAISILNPNSSGTKVSSAVLDGTELNIGPDGVEFPLKNGKHDLIVSLGRLDHRRPA